MLVCVCVSLSLCKSIVLHCVYYYKIGLYKYAVWLHKSINDASWMIELL